LKQRAIATAASCPLREWIAQNNPHPAMPFMLLELNERREALFPLLTRWIPDISLYISLRLSI